MSALAKSSRKAMQEKAKRLAATTSQKVDSSTWTAPEPLEADVKTGARPLVRRIYKSGGKVVGDMAKKRADRAARKSGGKTGEAADRSKRYLTPDNLINRDVRMANDDREGKKHVGAFKKGGRTKHADGMAADGDVIGDMIRKEMGRSTYTPPADLETPARPTRRSADSIIESGKAYQQMIDDELARRAAAAAAAKAKARKIYDTTGGMGGMGLKKGGKVSHMEWEHSKKDLAEDKKLAKKHGMSLEAWEKSKLDEKHDKQQSAKGLKRGGKTMHHSSCECKMCSGGRTMKADGGKTFSGNSTTKIPGVVGGRKAHKKGGKAKGKTHININIVPQSGGPSVLPIPPLGMKPPMPPMAPPMAPPMGAPPMGAPPMGGGAPPIPPAFAGAGAPRPMMRKSGGRTTHVIKHAAGGGLGRLEKIKAYGEPQKGLK